MSTSFEVSQLVAELTELREQLAQAKQHLKDEYNDHVRVHTELEAELTELRAMVRELAEIQPYCCACIFCGEDTVSNPHKPDCLWLRAQKWRG